MIRLSKRLAAIASLVPKDTNLLDIGCDHGLLEIYLWQDERCKKYISSDVNESALNNAKENILKYKADSKIETRLGNGLSVINSSDMIDTVVISGMGAHTIIGILKYQIDKFKIDTLIIQSNTKLEFLRKEITKLGYYIDSELIVEDNKKIYVIIRFKKGYKKYNKKELYFGPKLMEENSELFQEYKRIELEKLNIRKKLVPKRDIILRYKIKREINLYK